MRKEFKRMLYIIVALYICLVAVLFFKQRAMMYFPLQTIADPATFDLPEMNVIPVKTEDGLTITGWYKAPQEDDKPIIVLFHGNGAHLGYRAYKVRKLIDEGYGVMLAGYRGYAGNPGKPTEQGLYHDARAQIEWLRETAGVRIEDIVLYGESLGSGIATQMTTEYPQTKALILETPFSSTVDVAKGQFFFVPVSLLMLDRYENSKKIAAYKHPVFIMHGTSDNVIGFEYGERLYEAATEPKTFKVFEGGGHNDLHEHGAGEAVLEFLQTLQENDKEE